MAEIIRPRKNLTINPLKMSAPLGGAMAFMGVDKTMPLLHGSQGCTAFGMVLLVRHFREAIPFQTTAMSEITTILGGLDNLEQACLNIAKRTGCRVIGICTTGLTETRGEDLAGDLKLIKSRNPELADVELIGVSTPDYVGALETGWGRAVAATIDALTEPSAFKDDRKVNVLAGSHLTPADIDEIKDLIEAFGLEATVLPDLSGSLDGHVPDAYKGTTYGGVTVEDVRAMGRAAHTIALGEQMRLAAERLEAVAGVPFTMFDRVTGLAAVDALVSHLQVISGRSAPARVRRSRSQLVDTMLDGHFYFGRTKIAVAAEPDLLVAMSSFLAEMGAEIVAAVTSCETPVLDRVPAASVTVGDLDDLETLARQGGAEILVTHSHGRLLAERLGIPLFHAGFPVFDRLGAQHRCSVGYRGTRDLIIAIGNMLIERTHEPRPGDWPLASSHMEGPDHAAAKAH